MIASTVALVGALCHEHRMLLPLLEEHLEDNFDEVLPHLLLSDVVRFLAVHSRDRTESTSQIWQWLESDFAGGDDDERNLVIVSGVEMIPDPGEPGAEMREMLGAQLRQYDAWID